MEFSEVVFKRKSRRWFDKNKPVNKEVIEEVLWEAAQAPSFMNHQPWSVTVVGPEKMAEVSDLLERHQNAGTTTMPYPWPREWPERQKKNIEHTRELRAPHREEPTDVYNKWAYDAPVTVIIHIDSALNEWSVMDIGAFAQTLMLAAENRGIQSVPQAKLVNNVDELRKILDLPENHLPVLGISLGYAIEGRPSNTFQSPREPLEAWVSWQL